MDEQGIDVQVVATWADLFGYHLDVSEAVTWSRLVNSTLLEAVQDSARFAALATLPLQFPEAAAEMVVEVMSMGFLGVMVGTRVSRSELHDLEFDADELIPVWRAAADHNAVVFVHPSFCSDLRLKDYGLINALGRAQDTTIAVARLLYAGIPTRFEGLQFLLAHGGGTIPYLLGRLLRNYEIHSDTIANPLEGFRRLHFDSVVFDPQALRLLCHHATSARVLLGSDYPFPIGDPSPTAVVHGAGLSTDDTARLMGGNAAQLFGIDRQGEA